MIYVICSGGIGNQMFQYALYYALVQNKREACLDTSFYLHNQVHNGFELTNFFGIEAQQNDKDLYSPGRNFAYHLMEKIKLKRFGNIIIDDYLLDLKKIPDNAILNGYWQSWRFFNQYESELKSIFAFNNPSKKAKMFSQIICNDETVAMHIRRGDYLQSSVYINLAESNYYRNAVNYFRKTGEVKNLIVFSDDIQWCRKNLKFDLNITYVNNDISTGVYDDLYLMSSARKLIVANSSFSWWAGYLGMEKQVVCPNIVRKDWDTSRHESYYPEQWVRIKN